MQFIFTITFSFTQTAYQWTSGYLFSMFILEKINRVSLMKKVKLLKNDLIQYFQVFEQIISLPLSPNLAWLKPTPTPPP